MQTNYEARTSSRSVDTAPILASTWDVVFHLRELVGAGEMIIELEMAFAERLDESVLSRAVELLFEAEPILRRRLVIDTGLPHWQAVEDFQAGALRIASNASEYEAFRHSGLNTVESPQIAVCLWHDADLDRLIVKVTHAITDAGGLKTICGRLASIYTELQKDTAFRPVTNPPGNRDIYRVISGTSWRNRLQIPLDLLKVNLAMRNSENSVKLPQPSGPSDPWVYVVDKIEPPRVSSLIAYGRAHGATVNDVFLAAMYRAIAGDAWQGDKTLRIFMTLDLRRWYLPPEDAGSICNMSSFELPFLQRNLGRSFDETLRNVVRITQQSKKNRPGLAACGLAHWLRPRKALTGSALKLGLNLVREKHNLPAFSNTGPMDSAAFDFGSARPISAHILPPKTNAPSVMLCLSGYDGSLTLTAGTPLTSKETMAAFIERVIAQLPA